MRRFQVALRASLLILGAAVLAAAQPPQTRSLNFDRNKRAYQLLIPTQATAATPVPLIVLLHGFGGNGQRVMVTWQDLAREQGIAIAAPNALGPGWVILNGDGPDFFQALVETIKTEVPVDGRRVYLVGHSSGGHQALLLGPLESEYFAAVAVHAGAINASEKVLVQEARRKIPIGMWHGTADEAVSIQMGRRTRDILKSLEFPVTLNEIPGHTHDYYGRSARINAEIWTFLKAHALTTDPIYRPYTFKR